MRGGWFRAKRLVSFVRDCWFRAKWLASFVRRGEFRARRLDRAMELFIVHFDRHIGRSSRRACHPDSRPSSRTPAIHQREGQGLYNRRRLDVKVDGQGHTAKFLDLPINSMAKNDGNIDGRNCLYSRLRAIQLQRPEENGGGGDV